MVLYRALAGRRRSLVPLGVTELDPVTISRTLPVLLKNQPDHERASSELDLVKSAHKEPQTWMP
jgi:hypothetical protein